MARTIVVVKDGCTSAFTLAKVDRSSLYGSRRRVQLDPSGRPARRGALTRDGSLVLQPGMTAQGYFDERGMWWPLGELVGLDRDGKEVARQESTLGVPVPLEGPLPATGLLDLRVQSVYMLDPDEEHGLDDRLRAELEDGALFRFPFAYRDGFKRDEAWLVANDHGVFAIVGQAATAEWAELARLPKAEELDDQDDLDDEIDFEMF